MSTRATVPLRAGTVIGERYRVDRVLATGAMSVVYSAWDPVLRRSVALKALHPHDGEVVPLVRNGEARLAASVSHSALTAVFDAGSHRLRDGTVFDYIVMELLGDGDLRARLLHGPIPWHHTLQIGIDVCDALAELHAAGYLHRDVKPANVLLVRSGTDGVRHGKLADFGICSSRDDERTDFFGTAAYVSPEQVHGDRPTERSDVYALGLVLIETLTGTMEFPGSVDETAFARVRYDPVVPASVPPPLAAVLKAMTSRTPAARPSAAAAARRLRHVLRTHASRTDADGAERAAERARALELYDVLGWPPQRAFAAATTLACRLLVARSAFVAISTELGLFVSSPTRGVELPTYLRTSPWLEQDAHDRPWAIEDLRSDRRTRDDTTLLEAGLRAFAGAPLCTPAGERIGTLCVTDARSRQFSRRALDDLASLGGLVLEELELRMAARRAVLRR